MISLITIHHNREKHLQNLIYGVSNQTLVPDEIVIVNTGNIPDITVPDNLNVIWVDVDLENNSKIPIGSCRNMGFCESSAPHVVFIDVDCIPSSGFVEKITGQIKESSGLIMGQPKYLIEQVEKNLDDKSLDDLSVYHPQRPFVDKLRISLDPGLFWSLCFAVSREDFIKLGMFDEGFRGYGGEDTDLSFNCKSIGMPFYLSEAIVYHQQHGFFSPPINHLEDIVSNCNYFFDKWNHWCMSNYLKAFDELGLIKWDKTSSEFIKVLDKMDDFNMDQYYINDLPYA